MRKSIAFIFLLLLLGCQKEYDQETCNQLSMKAFKGSPRHAAEFKNNCQNVDVTYTKEICQKALNDLIISSDLESVKKTYGENVVGCFTENDLRAFKKEKSQNEQEKLEKQKKKPKSPENK